MRRWTGTQVSLVTGITSLLVVIGLGAGVPPAAAAGPHWSIAASAQPGTAVNLLSSVVLTRTRGWAVGLEQNSTGGSRTLIERYSANSRSWSAVTSPNAGTDVDNVLSGVAGNDANAWAVGSYGSYPSRRPLALHWNGSGWRVVPTPAVSNGQLSGVAVLSAKNVWAVGQRTSASGWAVPLVVHWNGARWTVVGAPTPAAPTSSSPRTATLSAVTRVPGTTQLFAVGTANDRGRGSGNAFVERWKGGRWSLMTLPSMPGGVDSLVGVTAFSPRSATAVGNVYAASPHTLVMHWNGSRWRRVITPDAGNGQLSAVGGATASAIWAVGSSQSAQGWTVPLIMRWNGSSWKRVSAPAAPIGSAQSCPGLTDGYQQLLGVAVAPGSRLAAAVGYHDSLTCNVPRRSLAERYA
jgi:hypothetical protein